MDRLHTLDAEFLYLEDAQSPMHIASICIFEFVASSISVAFVRIVSSVALRSVPMPEPSVAPQP